jgi:hypothetical protein
MSQSQVPEDHASHRSAVAEKANTASGEARAVAEVAADGAGHVAASAKEEAISVAREAKTQARDLYAQTKKELGEQAAAQQEKAAQGLRALGDELESMATSSSSPGVAADIVRQASSRITGAAEWLGERDPGSLVREVKNYARRSPGTFIAIAALAGVAAGRLTRALAANTADEKSAPSASDPAAPAPAPAPAPAMADTPVYSAAADARSGEGR